MPRTPTPNAILKRRGSKKTRDEIDPASGEVMPTFALGEEGQKAFSRICDTLTELEILSPSYAELITITAGAVGNIEIATRDLTERGHISITERGETKNPSFTMLTSSQTQAQKGLIALGLSPTSIGKLTGGKKKTPNPFEED